MVKEKIQEIMDKLEQAPDEPLLILTDHGAMEAFEQVRKVHQGAKLLVMKGMRYITITDAAVEVILEQLERERVQYVKTVENYDREIQDIREMIGSERKFYWAPNSTAPAPAIKMCGKTEYQVK